MTCMLLEDATGLDAAWCESVARINSVLHHLVEHLLNLSWNNACAREHSKKPCEVGRNNLNHSNGRNQVGTNLGTSLYGRAWRRTTGDGRR